MDCSIRYDRFFFFLSFFCIGRTCESGSKYFENYGVQIVESNTLIFHFPFQGFVKLGLLMDCMTSYQPNHGWWLFCPL